MDGWENQARRPTEATPEQFDVESYASLYTGHTKIARLHFIADHCNSRNLDLEALRMALDEIRKGENTVLFKECVERLNGRLGLGYGLDQEWIDTVERRAAQRQEKLEVELNGYKTNLIKESIRMGYNDLGDFHYSRGDLQQAFQCYVRTRDYCTTSKHIIAMCLNVILVSIELGHFVHVSNYVSKADQTPDVQDPVVLAKLKCAAGLAHLESKKYKLAARKFVDTNFELGSNYSDVTAPQDVATYGGLCALASFDRAELKSKVIDNINFRNFLELIPEVRELIHDFYARIVLLTRFLYFPFYFLFYFAVDMLLAWDTCKNLNLNYYLIFIYTIMWGHYMNK
uniref:26S proteasome regulatory subunit Rpn7 N-terminal domain-containing protein n=1 Tax=Physcomitrium patens TaxID=3218 RepID=A0A7I4EGU5_PHYPA